ncbi:MAG TPA: aldose 1-epimerase family protein [Acidimicrobiales bacterium]|jgi:aldose 1-epimerase
MPAPSGRQISLAFADQQLTVVEVGGGIRSYSVDGLAVLDGYRATEMCSGGRGQLLAPWPNRLGGGRFAWAGREWQTALTEPEQHNAIHGLARWANWTVADEAADSARLEYRLYPQPGWPWIVDLAVTYSLSAAGLEVCTQATNLPGGAGPCPFGVGWHPYLAAFEGSVDDAVLTVPAETTYVMDDHGLPVAKRPVEATDVDFRAGRRIGAAQLDTAFTDLVRGGEARAVVEFAAGGGSDTSTRRGAGRPTANPTPTPSTTRLWMDAAFTHLMVFSGDTLPEAGRRRRGLAVEPMTCAPDMLRTGDGRLVLEEGETFEATWGLSSSAGGS